MKKIFCFVFMSLAALSAGAQPRSKPVPGKLKDCDAGPRIMEIYNATPQGTNVTFHGFNVFGLDAKVFDEKERLVSSTSIVPERPEIFVRFSAVLNPGNYKLRLSGNTCNGQSEMAFTNLSVSARAAARLKDAGEVHYIARGYSEHLGVVITGTPGNWVINDTARLRPESGYEFRYMINAVVLTQGTALKNYRYQSNSPLRIWKMKTKIGLSSVNQWSDGERNHYFDPEAGKVFDDNVTAGFCTVVFKVSGKTDNANNFIPPVPSNYDPSGQNSVWADIAPDMKLPKGHFWVANRGDWSIETVMKKGVTHISNYQLPWKENLKEVQRLTAAGVTYNDVPRPEAFMNLKPSGDDKWVNNYNLKYWPNGPLNEKEAIEKANQTDDGHALWISETMEGNSYMPKEQPMWGYYYKRLRERYEAKFGAAGIPYLIAHNYFMFWPNEFKLGDRNGEREARKKLFSTPLAQFPNTEFRPGGTLSSTNLIVEGVYINAPDMQNGFLYNSLFRMELFKKMGYHAGVFLFGVHEWKGNNAVFYAYPDGKYYRKEKLPLDPNVIIAYAFLSQIYGSVYVEWGGQGKQVSAGKNWDTQWGTGSWYPNGSLAARDGFPHVVKLGQPSYTGYNGSSDLSYFGIKLYNDTFAKVEGGEKKYLKFRVDGAGWINPNQIEGENIVDAYYDQRGFVLSETKNGKTAWFYINSFADNTAHKLEVELPNGKILTETVAGNGVHVRVE
jgi:hypothetical protein